MNKVNSIPIDVLRAKLSYNPETGDIVRIGSEGVKFGYVDGSRYLRGQVCGVRITCHRIAWALYYGVWPNGQIDHINHDRFDNRIANLREVSCTENLRNAKRSSRNKSGVTGVSWAKSRNKWIAVITDQSKNINLGYFSDFDAAVAARKKAESDLGYHPNHGKAYA